MEKLVTMTKSQLSARYYDEFGVSANGSKEQIIAALYYGKRIDYLTQEEINSIEY